jgi:aurora kinase
LQYLHSKDVIHRDLKFENVLLQANGKLMLADFGLSVSLPPGIQLYDSCGTLDYRAPEALGGQGYSREIDMWALGVMTYEFLAGRLPFYSEDDAVVREGIVKADITPLPTSVSYLAREYVHSLLELDPCWRLSCNEALLDPCILEHCQRC